MATLTAEPTAASRSARMLFIVTILTGSFLLFLVQPMVARMALPRLGGAPAVWNSAMLVYQALLLGGYAYAHWLGARAPRQQGVVHIALFAVAALWLPVGLTALTPPSGSAVLFWVPWLLVASIGPLFFAVSAQAPLMQRWYALSGQKGEPYALYAASNFGSFAGLIAYPLLVEPFLSLRAQSWLWSALYILVALLTAACALTLRRSEAAAPAAAMPAAAAASAAPGWRQRLWWVLLAAIPSGLMLSTTTHLTTDLLAMPLIWALPLGLYLLSFTIAFASARGPADAITFFAPIVLLVAGGFSFFGAGSAWTGLGASIILLFTVAVALHTALYRARPDPAHLTAFYLMMSLGGALGGLFCAIVAPLLFDWTWEHPALIVAAAFLLPQKRMLAFLSEGGDGTGWRARYIAGGLIGVAIAVAAIYRVSGGENHAWMLQIAVLMLCGVVVTGVRPALAAIVAMTMLANGGWRSVEDSLKGVRTRSYFGIYTVRTDKDMRMLTHGTTVHGLQSMTRPTMPISYYGPGSGVGLALAGAQQSYGADARFGVVGLGTGTLACYRKGAMRVDFYEIDPAMVDIARNAGTFSYLARCAPRAPLHIGDARLVLAGQPARAFHLLAIDAFSSDAIPMHLLTAEAFGIYQRAITRDGMIVVHISNRFVDLEPVIAAQARAHGLAAAVREDLVSDAATAAGMRTSKWVVLTRDTARLGRLTGPLATTASDALLADRPVWRSLRAERELLWTDDYASVMPIMSLRSLFD